MKIQHLFVAAITAVLLSGCGGGSGSSTSSTGGGITSTAISIGGVAAVGSPIIAGTINVRCASGSALASTTTSSMGAWQVNLAGQTLPCAVQVIGGTINNVTNTTPYHSIATAPGTVNVTPLTDLMVANLAGTATPSVWFAGLSATPAPLTAINQASVTGALAKLSAALPALTSLNTINPITTAFTPTSGNVSDDTLTALKTAMTNTGITYTSLLNNASVPAFTAPVTGFGTALATAYAGTISGGTPSTATYIIGGTVSGLTGSLVLQDNNGDNLTVGANGSFTFATQVANGSPYSVTVLTHPASQSCSVANGTGTIALANVSNVTITCATNTYAYVVNLGSKNVSAYSIDANTGALTSIGSTATGFMPSSISVAKSRNFAYVSNYGDNSISAYIIDATTGALTSVGTYATGSFLSSVTIDPAGKFAYATGATDISGLTGVPTPGPIYSINTTTGALTSIGAFVAIPSSLTFEPTGQFAYGSYSNSSIASYSFNATNGALTKIGTFAAGTGSFNITVDPTGKFTYVANSGSNNISEFSINTTTGALINIGTIAAGTYPNAVTVDPTGKFAYAPNVNSNNVSAYSINSTTGVLSSIGTFTAGTQPVSVAVDPTGKFAYVANSGDSNLFAYSINATTGALTNIGTFAAGSMPSFITTKR